MAFRIVELNAEAFKAELDKIEEHFSDLEPVLEELGIQAERLWLNIFQREGVPKWAPLSESTLKRRRQNGRGAKILRDEGRLLNSLTERTGDSVYKLTPSSLEIGTNVPYASVHQDGGEKSGVNKRTGRSWSYKIPRRPFLPNDKQLNPMVKRVVERFVKEVGP